MSETRFTIELAKSGRSKCKRCKEPIPAKSIRIGTHSHNGEYEMSSWHHPQCFKLPMKYARGADKMSVEDFVRDILEDNDKILKSGSDDIIKKIEAASQPAKKGAKKSIGGGKVDPSSPIAEIKAAYEKEQKELADGKTPSSKKAKSDLSVRLDAYEKYKGCKNAELQDILRYNRQILKGSKDFMLAKVIDGVAYGRLSRCELCGGTLKMTEDGKSIECGGGFDEATQRRLECSFTCTPADAPRWQPWYEEEPTEEEEEAIDKLIEEYKEAGGKPAGKSDEHEKDVETLLEAAEELEEWKLTTKDGIKASVAALAELLSQEDMPELDLPKDGRKIRMKLGEVVQRNRDKTASEVMQLVIDEFGFAEVKKAKAAQKQAAQESSAACSANAPVIAALQELGELYFKEGNRNAGSTYVKAVKALRELEFEVTEDNAKQLCKGKDKVPGIGKGTADKIYEFVTTDTIEKLEEKRAAAS